MIRVRNMTPKARSPSHDTGIKTTLMTDGRCLRSRSSRPAASSRQGGPKREDVTSGPHKPGQAEQKTD